MIRVLHINAGSGIFGGVSAFCLNIYRNINRDEIQFDFLTPNRTTYAQYRQEIEACGGHLFELGINSSNTIGKIRLQRALKSFLKKRSYDIIHVNSGVLLFNYAVASACRKYSDSIIFVHSHSNGGRTGLKERFSAPLKSLLVKDADCLLACSKSAAEYMFPAESIPKTNIINNGIIVDSFRYDPQLREAVRKEMDLENRFVIGHVGRFTGEKNHKFLVRLMPKVKQMRDDAILLLIGEGPLLEETKEMAKQLGVEKDVMFLGARSDLPRLYQAMDVFMLPSLFEGFGIVNIEAQTAGLKCITSTAVPEAVNVTGNVARLPLDGPDDNWVREMCTVPGTRSDHSKEIKEKGFDMVTSARELERLYKEAVKNG